MDTKLSLSLMCIIYKIKFKKLHTYINLTEFEKQNYQQKKQSFLLSKLDKKKPQNIWNETRKVWNMFV